MLDVDASRKNNAVDRYCFLRIILGAGSQVGSVREVARELVWKAELVIDERLHKAVVTGVKFGFRTQILFSDFGQTGSGERAIQLVNVEACDSRKRGRCTPLAVLDCAVFQLIRPLGAAVRAVIDRSFRQSIAENFVAPAFLMLPGDVLPGQRLPLAAVRTFNKKISFVTLAIGGLDLRNPGNGRRSAEDDFSSGEGLSAFFEKLDRIALLLNVRITVVRLFHTYNRSRRGLHFRRRVRTYEL